MRIVSEVIARDRTTVLAAIALAVATILSWVALAHQRHAMDVAGYLTAWTLMMAAMMLPSIAPLVLLHRGSRTLLAAGYLAFWGVIGLVPFAGMHWNFQPAVPIVLALAGVYELSPLKSACLRHCRGPVTFLMERYRHGAFRLGVEHAIWCTGCCLGLMAVLVLAAAMHLLWAAVIAIIVFVQKILPFGELSARVTGVVLLAAAALVAFL